MNKFIAHLKTVCCHKKYVLKNCLVAGMPVRGILHDLSKFSPTEFLESVKYYQGNRSPIDACKEENEYSEAWLHHKGRNRHHYEYWQDNFDKGGIPLQMPFKDALELVCDYIGAGMAYGKDNFTYQGEYEWWRKKCSKPIAMHPQTRLFVEMMLKNMADHGNNECLHRSRAIKIYDKAERIYKKSVDSIKKDRKERGYVGKNIAVPA